MTENLKVFCRQLSEDEELNREFKELLANLRASRIEAIVGFAESHDIDLVAEDFVFKTEEGEISEGELQVVTGGFTGNNDDGCGLPVAVEDPYNYWWS